MESHFIKILEVKLKVQRNLLEKQLYINKDFFRGHKKLYYIKWYRILKAL